MLTYDMEKRGATPIYFYLYKCIKSDIEKGVIKPNEKLPSKRSLAEHLKISVMTVQNAYMQLMSEGYIYSKTKSGYFAHSLEIPFTVIPNKNIAAIPRKNTSEGDKYFIDFRDNNINTDIFPFSVWSGVIRKVLGEYGGETLKKLPNAGVKKLREAIAGLLYRFRGMEVSPERIIIGAGTEYLYGLLVKLLGKDKIYAVEDPGYGKIAAVYKSEGVECRYIALDGYGLSSGELIKSDADIVHISPSHHFPTGIVMPAGRRREILGWVYSAPERYIIEDDYDSEFRFTGKPLPTMESIDTQGRVIYMNTFSKTISPSLRISYIVLPAELLERYNSSLGFYSCTVSGIEQYALAEFIDGGYFERHINRMRKAYKTKRDLIIKQIKDSPLGEKATILEEDSGLHFIIKLKTDLNDREIIGMVKVRGINISCLSQYGNRQEGMQNSMFIINYSGIDMDCMAKAVEILADTVNHP